MSNAIVTTAGPRRGGRRTGRPADRVVVATTVSLAVWAVDLVLFSDITQPSARLSPTALVVRALPVLGLLLLRRRHPVAVALLVSACMLPAAHLLMWTPALSVTLAVGTAAARAGARTSLMCLAAALTATWFALVVEVDRDPALGEAGALIGVGTICVLVEGGAWVAGRWSAANRRRATQLEQQRERALADERARVSRELHDIVAHSVTVMLLHAAVARRAVAQGAPETAVEPLRVIEDTGGQAINELRRMLRLLRADVPATQRDPLPTFDGIPELIEGIRRSGVDVEIRTTGEPEPLDPSVSLAAFRAVQEALTNTLRHAGVGARAVVEVSWSSELLTLCVSDDGGGTAEPRLAALSTGAGLVGLRERVAIAGGHLESGPGPERGWRLAVSLPVTGASLRHATTGVVSAPMTVEDAS